MTDRKPPLDDFDARLRAARERQNQPHGKDGDGPANPQSGLGFAMRIGVEMVSALVVGVGIGWLLDRWLGTAPWLLVVFLFLGMAAGVMNVFRATSGLGSQVGYRPYDGENADRDSGRERD